MKKIAHICTSALSHKILVDKLHLLTDKEYEIDIISSEEGYNPSLLDGVDLQVKFVDMSRSISLRQDHRSLRALTKLFKEEQYDIVHTHTAKAGILGRIAAKKAGVPLVLHTSHGLPFFKGQGMLKNQLYKLFERVGAFYSDGILSQNKEDMIEIKKIARSKEVYYEGNGVDLEKLDELFNLYDEGTKENLYEELRLAPNTFIFLMAARFEDVKDPLFLLEGLMSLKKDLGGSDFVCLLAGRGPLEAVVREKIAEYNLYDNVRIIGHRTDIYKYICNANAIVLTSKKEGVPRIIMESMAAGKMVVATDVLGTRELVGHEETGLLVPYRDISSLAVALKRAMDEDTKKYEEKARRRIENHYTESHVVERIDEVYKELWLRKTKK